MYFSITNLLRKILWNGNGQNTRYDTLKREPIDENFEDLEEDLVESSGSGGNRPATKEHLEALNRS